MPTKLPSGAALTLRKPSMNTIPSGRASGDEYALFNPAYIAAVLAAGADGHQREYGSDLPITLAWLLPVMAVPRAIRDELPASVRLYLTRWLDSNPLVRPTIHRLAPLYAPTTRQALRFAVRHDVLALTSTGIRGGTASRRFRASVPDEVADSLNAARLLARWLPRAGPPPTIFTLIGLRP